MCKSGSGSHNGGDAAAGSRMQVIKKLPAFFCEIVGKIFVGNKYITYLCITNKRINEDAYNFNFIRDSVLLLLPRA